MRTTARHASANKKKHTRHTKSKAFATALAGRLAWESSSSDSSEMKMKNCCNALVLLGDNCCNTLFFWPARLLLQLIFQIQLSKCTIGHVAHHWATTRVSVGEDCTAMLQKGELLEDTRKQKYRLPKSNHKHAPNTTLCKSDANSFCLVLYSVADE